MLLRHRLSMHCFVNLPGLRFVDCKDVHKILHIRGAQPFQVREPGFHERDRLFLGDGKSAGQRLRRLHHFLFNRGCRRSVLIDVDLPTGQP